MFSGKGGENFLLCRWRVIKTLKGIISTHKTQLRSLGNIKLVHDVLSPSFFSRGLMWKSDWKYTIPLSPLNASNVWMNSAVLIAWRIRGFPNETNDGWIISTSNPKRHRRHFLSRVAKRLCATNEKKIKKAEKPFTWKRKLQFTMLEKRRTNTAEIKPE